MGLWDGTSPLPVGTYKVTISKVKTEFKGKPIQFNDGTRCIRITFVDSEESESECQYPIEGKFVWKLRDVLRACGHDPDKMEGITPLSFGIDAVCNQFLTGCSFEADVTERKAGDKTFVDVVPAKKKKATDIKDADIPF